MILPMKKVSLVVMDKEREAALKKLREVGVVHLERKNAASDALSRLMEQKTRLDTALGILRNYEVAETVRVPAAQETMKETLELGESRKSCEEQLLALVKERTRIEKWGNFDPRGIAFLAERGVRIFLYEFPRKAFAALPPETKLFVCGSDKNTVYAAVFDKEVPGETAFVLPELSLAEIDAKAAETRKTIAEIEKRLAALAAGKVALETERKALLSSIEFETARAGMELSSDVPAEQAVAWLTGFAPQEDLGLLKRAAAENGWALAADDPAPSDQVPTKLRNNRLVNLINPLTGFLEVTPGYREVDISGWFLLFFTIFFGMIFGDAGYGALVLIAGFAGILATARKGVPQILKLLVLLGFSNFLWGVLTCSWFGVSLASASFPPAFAPVRDALVNVSLPLISNVPSPGSYWKPLLDLFGVDIGGISPKIVQQNLMIICFSLALLQLSIGHIIGIFRNRSLKSLADLGSIAMLFGMYCIILFLIVTNEARAIPLFPLAVPIFAGGFLLNFVFASYEGHIGRSILESFKNIIPVILGIANVFSDIMSYIRLWAVGLAGAAIADTVDKMAGPMLGHLALFVFGVVLLVFGHGLNLVLNTLSVLVHGVRLNTLEFSSHVGLTWAGSPYRPFAEKVRTG